MTRARDVATQGGLVLIAKTDFSNTSQFDFVNCFSSTYDNYRITAKFSSGNADIYFGFRFLNGTTPDATAGSYNWSWYGFTNAAGNNSSNSTGADFGYTGCDLTSSGYYSALSLDFFSPNIAEGTRWTGVTIFSNTTRSGGGRHNQATAYNGIRFFPGSGTTTGTLAIYGYRKN